MECSWGPMKFFSRNGVLNGVEFQRCLQVYDACGAFQPAFDSCELLPLEADTVIVAIGQVSDTEFLEMIGLNHGKLDPLTLQASDEMVFFAGDVVSGTTSVVEAMAGGRQAAESVHRLLSGEHPRYGRQYAGPVETEFKIETCHATSPHRLTIPKHQLSGKGDFTELERGVDAETARKEASRCLSCGQPFGKYRNCWFCLPCEVDCPHDALYVEVPYLLR
jgi:formate dehydrogenase major subunit